MLEMAILLRAVRAGDLDVFDRELQVVLRRFVEKFVVAHIEGHALLQTLPGPSSVPRRCREQDPEAFCALVNTQRVGTVPRGLRPPCGRPSTHRETETSGCVARKTWVNT
jgi:hypothetical protein